MCYSNATGINPSLLGILECFTSPPTPLPGKRGPMGRHSRYLPRLDTLHPAAYIYVYIGLCNGQSPCAHSSRHPSMLLMHVCVCVAGKSSQDLAASKYRTPVPISPPGTAPVTPSPDTPVLTLTLTLTTCIFPYKHLYGTTILTKDPCTGPRCRAILPSSPALVVLSGIDYLRSTP